MKINNLCLGFLLQLVAGSVLAAPISYTFTQNDLMASDLIYRWNDNDAQFSGFVPVSANEYKFSITGINIVPSAFLVGQTLGHSKDFSGYGGMMLDFHNTSTFQVATTLFAVSQGNNNTFNGYGGALKIVNPGENAQLSLDFAHVPYVFELSSLFSPDMTKRGLGAGVAVNTDQIYSYGVAFGIGQWGSNINATKTITGQVSVPEPEIIYLLTAGMCLFAAATRARRRTKCSVNLQSDRVYP